ncbi:MAG: peptidylprolyl isomerase [Spirochaetales bacterium]|jgi:FKBP-type peptidyl-prolyl cis-trans isomerase SlyD|nr:peptidylprolyl isomerase [Spirochaetales bacterium]
MKVGNNTAVTIDYVLREKSGRALEDTAASGPLTYLHGRHLMLAALERGLAGAEEGQRVSLSLPPEEAYGLRDESLTLRVPLAEWEDPESLRPGEEVRLVNEAGRSVILRVAGREGEDILLDGNHPFAGMELCFEITVRKVVPAPPEDSHHPDHPHHHGHLHGGCDSCGGCAGALGGT